MPVYNTEDKVAEAVSSVLGQQGCIAEVLISDDCSTDRTLEVALGIARAYRGPHSITVLRTARRLAIDHLGTLVRKTTNQLIVQAHGDDISLANRLATLLETHRRTGASLVTSGADWKTDTSIIGETMRPPCPAGWLPLDILVATNPGMLAGARYAIDRAVFERFPPLNSDYLPIGHDVLQPFRAALLTGVWYCAESLVCCGWHKGRWSYRLWDTRFPAANRFGFLLNRLGVMRAMKRDLEHALATGLLPPDRISAAAQEVDKAANLAVNQLLQAREELRRMGREPLWVPEDELARANQG
jgi:glycosyltransferase involved in cell wall biosynthesis